MSQRHRQLDPRSFSRSAARMAVSLSLWIVAVPVSGRTDAARLTMLDGSQRTAEIQAISPSALVLNGGQTHRLEDLRRIELRPVPKSSRAAGVVVDLFDGGRLLADTVSVADEICTVTGVTARDLILPLEAIETIRLQPKQVDDQMTRSFSEGDGQDDRLYVMVDGNQEMIHGLIERVDRDTVVFQWDEQQRSIARDKVVAISVASVGDQDRDQNCFVQLQSGSAVWATITGLDDGQLRLQLVGDAEVDVQWDDVSHIQIRSPRLTYISDLEPIQAEHHPIVTSTRPWRRDKNVSEGPLTLGEQTFVKGIGVAATSRLVFDLRGEFTQACAIIGIDADTQSRGDCVFVLRGDQRELYRQRVKGGEAARRLLVDVTDVKRLELIVEAGENLDLADHANWCDACLIRN